jgi:GNAT superfamily N-acetyltransferase|tara:strand:- start:641 stop:1147 length:507 start_codon:yes stop_codon:yes gene_type:complete
VTQRVERNYLEITSVKDLKENNLLTLNCSITLLEAENFQINKFFYKIVGKKHNWTDRLSWSESQWIKYSSDEKVKTYILKVEEDLAGYYELIFYNEKKEVEIAYLGLLKNYHNQKLGSYLLSSAIKNSFKNKIIKRVWVHTCSLDHKYALNNYLKRGMKIFKNEVIEI